MDQLKRSASLRPAIWEQAPVTIGNGMHKQRGRVVVISSQEIGLLTDSMRRLANGFNGEFMLYEVF